jgi:hypothetical protein
VQSQSTHKPDRKRIWLIVGIAAAALCLCTSAGSIVLLAAVLFSNGSTFAPAPPAAPAAISLVKDGGLLEAPLLFADSRGAIHLFWNGPTAGGNSDIQQGIFHMQLEGGGKWSAKENVVADFNPSVSSQPIVRSAPDGRICLFWYGLPANSVIGYGWYWRCRSENTWSAANLIADPGRPMSTLTPAFSADGSLQFVYWGPDGLYFGDTLLSDREERIFGLRFVIDGAGGYHVAWKNDDPSVVRYRFSSDSGSHWQPVESIVEDSSGVGVPSFDLWTDPQGSIHLFWTDISRIYHRRNVKDAWNAPETAADAGMYPPSILACTVDDRGLAYVFWQNYFSPTNTYGAVVSRQQADGGWSKLVWIVSPRRSLDLVARQLTMAVDKNGRMHFVWQRMYIGDTGPAGSSLDYTSLQ